MTAHTRAHTQKENGKSLPNIKFLLYHILNVVIIRDLKLSGMAVALKKNSTPYLAQVKRALCLIKRAVLNFLQFIHFNM